MIGDWLPYLEETGISVYGEWFFIAPSEPLRALQTAWDEREYPYEAASIDDLPVEYHESELFADKMAPGVVAIEEYCFDKRQLVRRLAAGHHERILFGEITDFGFEQADEGSVIEWVDVDGQAAGERIRLTPSYVLVAVGGGTPKIINDIADAGGEAGGDEAEIRTAIDQVTFDRVHMLTLRSPSEALPDVSAIIVPKKLKIVSHRSVGHDGQDGEDDLVTWYVTNKPLSPIKPDDASGEASASVDPEHATAGFNPLFSAVPGVRERATDGTIEFYVYAGCKQGIGGASNVPYCEPIDGIANAALALPSVAGGAWSTAKRAVELVESSVEPSGTTVAIPGAGNVTIGDVPEHGSDVEWLSWQELRAAYPGIVTEAS